VRCADLAFEVAPQRQCAAFAQKPGAQPQSQTGPETTLKVDVKLVNVYVTVTDGHGAPIKLEQGSAALSFYRRASPTDLRGKPPSHETPT